MASSCLQKGSVSNCQKSLAVGTKNLETRNTVGHSPHWPFVAGCNFPSGRKRSTHLWTGSCSIQTSFTVTVNGSPFSAAFCISGQSKFVRATPCLKENLGVPEFLFSILPFPCISLCYCNLSQEAWVLLFHSSSSFPLQHPQLDIEDHDFLQLPIFPLVLSACVLGSCCFANSPRFVTLYRLVPMRSTQCKHWLAYLSWNCSACSLSLSSVFTCALSDQSCSAVQFPQLSGTSELGFAPGAFAELCFGFWQGRERGRGHARAS